MSELIPAAGTPFGDRVRRRLSRSHVIWFTSTGADGTPQPNPVWFLWGGADSILVYNRSNARRLAHIAARPRVALNLDGNGQGGDIIVLAGSATIAPQTPAADAHEAYLAKYADAMASVSGSVAAFATDYSVPVLVQLDRVRGN